MPRFLQHSRFFLEPVRASFSWQLLVKFSCNSQWQLSCIKKGGCSKSDNSSSVTLWNNSRLLFMWKGAFKFIYFVELLSSLLIPLGVSTFLLFRGSENAHHLCYSLGTYWMKLKWSLSSNISCGCWTNWRCICVLQSVGEGKWQEFHEVEPKDN